MTELLHALGKRIEELRTAHGLTKKALAEAAEISEKYIGDIERGKYRVTITVLVRIAQALGTEGWALLQHAERKVR